MSTDIRQQLTPQMADYDSLPVRNLPYIMFMHMPNHVSPAVCTDSKGFRYSTDPDGKPLSIDNLDGRECNLFVGGSTAFGVGASKDQHSLPAILSRNSGNRWLNFAGRSFSAMQELLLFQTFYQKLGPVKKIVLFTGINSLILHYLVSDPPEDYGAFYHWSLFKRTMDDALMTPNRRRLATLLRPIVGDDIDFNKISLKDIPGALFSSQSSRGKSVSETWESALKSKDANREQLLPGIKRDFMIWKHLAAGIDAELIFVLQPFYNWMNKTETEEEKKLFAHLDNHPHNQFRILRSYINKELHGWYASQLEQLCGLYGIPFIDMNARLLTETYSDKWLFVDRAHFTDLGNAIIADSLPELM